MPQTCCILKCSEKAASGNSVMFHRFPKDETRKKIWEDKINEEYAQICEKQIFKAKNHSRICSRHFSDNSYDREALGGSRLKPEAVPSIFAFQVQSLKEHKSNEHGPCMINYNDCIESVPSSSKDESCMIVLSSIKIEPPDQESDDKIDTLSSKSGFCMLNYKDYTESVPSSIKADPLYVPDQESDYKIDTLSSKSGSCMVNYKDHTEFVPSSNNAGIILDQESNYETVTLSSKSGSSRNPHAKKRKSYLGDFTENDVYSPERMKKFMELAHQQASNYKQKVRLLQQENKRLKKKVKSLNDRIDEMK